MLPQPGDEIAAPASARCRQPSREGGPYRDNNANVS